MNNEIRYAIIKNNLEIATDLTGQALDLLDEISNDDNWAHRLALRDEIILARQSLIRAENLKLKEEVEPKEVDIRYQLGFQYDKNSN